MPKELLQQAEVLQMMFNLLLVLIAGHLAVGRRHRHHEHHAGHRDRAHPRDRHSPGLGAKQRDIVAQFLSETVVLSATGGLLGVVFGFLCKPAIVGARAVMRQLFPDVIAALPPNIQHLEPRIAPWSIVAAFLISVGVGVVFGIYPAQRAPQHGSHRGLAPRIVAAMSSDAAPETGGPSHRRPQGLPPQGRHRRAARCGASRSTFPKAISWPSWALRARAKARC